MSLRRAGEVILLVTCFFKTCNKNKTVCVQDGAQTQRFKIGDRFGLEIFKTFYFHVKRTKKEREI
jgi:hypothetical protein